MPENPEEIGYGLIRLEGVMVKDDSSETPFDVEEEVKGGGSKTYLVKGVRVESRYEAEIMAKHLAWSRYHLNERARRRAARGLHPAGVSKPKKRVP